MGRTSRRDLVKGKKKEEKINSVRAGIYTRLSQERQEEWRNKSCSIESQIEICSQYIEKENMTLVKVYTDYEYSGANFDRPGYKEMMEDVRNGIINCIVIRDLSRLGREHLEMGRLVDKVFPFLGVRFISVVDKIDTDKGMDAKLSFEMLIKNLINDMYVKDVASKVKSSKHTKAKSGYFIGSNPPFGYKVVEKDGGRKLEPDEVSSKVIQKIFELYISGESAFQIAKHLNEEGISTSSAYHKTGNIKREPDEPQWRKGTVANMLRQQVYIGHLVQATKENIPGKKSGHYREKPKEQWIVVRNAHEPIISEDDFYLVQEIMDGNKAKNYFEITRPDLKRNKNNKYKNIIYDGNTGLSLTRMSVRCNKKNANHYNYKFTNETGNGTILETSYIAIYEDEVDNLVIRKLKSVLSTDATGSHCKEKIIEVAKIKAEVVSKERNSISFKIKKLNSDFKELYENYSLGRIDRDEYLKEREKNKKMISDYEKELGKLDLELVSIETQADDEIALFDELYKDGKVKLTEDILKSYVERIDFYNNETVDIKLKGHFDRKEMKDIE